MAKETLIKSSRARQDALKGTAPAAKAACFRGLTARLKAVPFQNSLSRSFPNSKTWFLGLVWAGTGILLSLAAVSPAWGSLGGDAASVQADQVQLQGTLQSTSTAAYTVQEIQCANGAVVREYVSPQGKVFGIAWHGAWPPDMRQLLGSYFDQFMQASKAQPAGRTERRAVTIRQPGLVVQMAGHPRSFTGRAYLPDQMPSSVTAEAIR